MSLPRALTVRAGRTALAQLKKDGFSADAFSTMLGASGGPKWLVRYAKNQSPSGLSAPVKRKLVNLCASTKSLNRWVQ